MKILEKLKPEAVLVLGDTNSALSAISAKKNKIPNTAEDIKIEFKILLFLFGTKKTSDTHPWTLYSCMWNLSGSIFSFFEEKEVKGEITIVLKGIEALLDESAISAVKDTRFKPAKQMGRPVAVWVTIPLEFRLWYYG